MARCSFCRGNIEQGTGKLLILKDGRTMNFCSRKCEKNQNLGRVGRELKWTTAFRQEKKQAERGKRSAAHGSPAPVEAAKKTHTETKKEPKQ